MLFKVKHFPINFMLPSVNGVCKRILMDEIASTPRKGKYSYGGGWRG